jgi:hypothetical protein
MNLRWLVIFGLGAFFLATPFLAAAEPYLEFVEGLRKNNYHDYALIYLEKLEKRADVPAEIKAVIPFEKGITLIDEAKGGHDFEAQSRQYDQARAYLEQFLKASPNHPNAGRANTELANVIVGKGRVEVLKSKSPSNAGSKADSQKKARGYFAEARKVFQAAHDRYKEAYDKFDKYYDPVKQKAKHEAREVAYLNYIQAQLNLAVMTYEEAQTWDKGSTENKKLLTEAANTFDKIHGQYRQMIAGLYARMWQGKCFEEQDDLNKALGVYNELLGHGGDKPPKSLKELQDRVRHFRLVCLNREQRKDYAVVIEEAEEWLKKNRGPAANTRTGLGIQWELVRALELLAKKEETGEKEKNRLLQQALTIARGINRYAGEYKDGSTAMIARLKVELNRDPGDPKDFGTAFGEARNLVQEIAKQRTEIENTASGSEAARLSSELQPTLKEAARILNIGLSLAGPKDEAKEVNQARYFLAYVYFTMRDSAIDRSYDSAVLAEFIARKSVTSQPDLALDAAYLAQAAFIQAYHHPPKDNPRAAEAKQAADFQRIIGVCNFITTNWPASDRANDARMALGRVYSEIGQPAEAAKWYVQVPESAPQYLTAQLEAGNAFWYAYVNESIRPEAERKPKEELDTLLGQSQEILKTSLAKFEAQLPGEANQVDQTKLGDLTRAKLNYTQILNGTGDYKGALSLLTDGRLSIVNAVAAPADGPRPPKGSIKSQQFAGAVYQVLLRTYVGLQDLDKARETMRELEKIVGTSGGGASLTKIYVDLGKKLQEEVGRLQAARDPRLADVLKSFETFLGDLSGRKEGQDYNSLTWVGETYRSLGEGLQQGDSARAEKYFSKAGEALQALLDEEAKKPGTIPAGGVLGVKLKIVKCKRLQKDFDEAHKLMLAILAEKSRALDVQEEAARLFQDWAASGELDKWEIAIEGGSKNKKSKEDARVWGWFGLTNKLRSSLQNNPNPEYEQKFLDASYNVADCWLKYANAQSSDAARKKLLGEAYKAVERPAMLIPSLGGGESWARFNLLFRKIQQEMLNSNMEQMRGKEVADLERRSLSKEERAKAEAALREARDELASTDDEGAAAPKTKRKKTKKAAAQAKPKPASGTGWMAIVAVVVAVAGGGAYFFLAGGKKKKRRPRVASAEPELDFGEPKPPPAKVKR